MEVADVIAARKQAEETEKQAIAELNVRKAELKKQIEEIDAQLAALGVKKRGRKPKADSTLAAAEPPAVQE